MAQDAQEEAERKAAVSAGKRTKVADDTVKKEPGAFAIDENGAIEEPREKKRKMGKKGMKVRATDMVS